MRALTASLALIMAVSASACGSRQVEVTTGGTDVFLKQVAANSMEVLPVAGISAGTTVTLKARTVDGTRTYTRDNVYLASNYEWRVP